MAAAKKPESKITWSFLVPARYAARFGQSGEADTAVTVNAEDANEARRKLVGYGIPYAATRGLVASKPHQIAAWMDEGASDAGNITKITKSRTPSAVSGPKAFAVGGKGNLARKSRPISGGEQGLGQAGATNWSQRQVIKQLEDAGKLKAPQFSKAVGTGGTGTAGLGEGTWGEATRHSFTSALGQPGGPTGGPGQSIDPARSARTAKEAAELWEAWAHKEGINLDDIPTTDVGPDIAKETWKRLLADAKEFREVKAQDKAREEKAKIQAEMDKVLNAAAGDTNVSDADLDAAADAIYPDDGGGFISDSIAAMESLELWNKPTGSSAEAVNKVKKLHEKLEKEQRENLLDSGASASSVSGLSGRQLELVTGLMSGSLTPNQLQKELNGRDFQAVRDTDLGPIVNPALTLAVENTTRQLEIAGGIEQASISALGGLTPEEAKELRTLQAKSGSSDFGALAAAGAGGDIAPEAMYQDIQRMMRAQASGGLTGEQNIINAMTRAASGGLTQEADIIAQQQAAVAQSPWAALQLGAEQDDISNILRGGLTADQQLELAGESARAAGNPYGRTANADFNLQNRLARGGLGVAQQLTLEGVRQRGGLSVEEQLALEGLKQRGGLEEAHLLDEDQLQAEGQRQRGGLTVDDYMEAQRGGLDVSERLAEIRAGGEASMGVAGLQAAASGPYGYMQQQLGTGLNDATRAAALAEVGQMQRGGLTVEQQLALARAPGNPFGFTGQQQLDQQKALARGGLTVAERLAEVQASAAPQQLASYLDYIGNPAAVAASRQGGFAPFDPDFLQRIAASPSGTVPQEFAGITAPTSTTTPISGQGLPQTSAYAGGLAPDATQADWANLSQGQQRAAEGEYSMAGIAPDVAQKQRKSVTPQSTTNLYSSYT